MVAPSAGDVVLVPFPYSDLSQTKVRPAVCLADAGRGDWILCQVTSNSYGDTTAGGKFLKRLQFGSFGAGSFAQSSARMAGRAS